MIRNSMQPLRYAAAASGPLLFLEPMLQSASTLAPPVSRVVKLHAESRLSLEPVAGLLASFDKSSVTAVARCVVVGLGLTSSLPYLRRCRTVCLHISSVCCEETIQTVGYPELVTTWFRYESGVFHTAWRRWVEKKSSRS